MDDQTTLVPDHDPLSQNQPEGPNRVRDGVSPSSLGLAAVKTSINDNHGEANQTDNDPAAVSDTHATQTNTPVNTNTPVTNMLDIPTSSLTSITTLTSSISTPVVTPIVTNSTSTQSTATLPPTNKKSTVINSSGICTSCFDINAVEKSVKCELCNTLFHAMCRLANGGMSPILSNKTFLDHYKKRIEKEDMPGTFCFICDPSGVTPVKLILNKRELVMFNRMYNL